MLKCKDLHRQSNGLGILGMPRTASIRRNVIKSRPQYGGGKCKDLHRKSIGSVLKCKDVHWKSNGLGSLGMPGTARNRRKGVKSKLQYGGGKCKDLHRKSNGSEVKCKDLHKKSNGLGGLMAVKQGEDSQKMN